MRKDYRRLKHCERIIALVILLSFLNLPMFGEEPMKQSENLSENETSYLTSSEVELLIDDLSLAAKEAIEKAAAEAAKAAALEMLEREAVAIREAQHWKAETELAKKAGIKNAVFVGAICFIGGLALGVTGAILISN